MTAVLAAVEGTDAFSVLPVLVIVPVLGAILLALIPGARPDVRKQIAFLFSAVTGALSVWVMLEFDTAESGFQFVARQPWIDSIDASLFFGIDGISLWLVVLTGLLFPLAIIGIDPEHDDKPYFAWLLLLEAGAMGVFLSLDLLMFFLFFEVVLIPMYFLIGRWGHGNRRYAAMKFFIYTMFGSAFMLIGMLALVYLHARETGGGVTFDLVQIAEAQSVATTTARWLFLSFAVAFAVKVPIFPLHTWLPDAHTEAPTAGSVILAGIMLKLGTYGFLRFGLYLFPEASVWFGPAFLTLGTIGIIYGAVVATMQKDLKRLVAYSSVAHLGFIVIGTFAINTEGVTGAILQMVNHGISTGALFLLVGMVYERRHTREIAALKGLQSAAPLLAGVFTVVMLSSIGLPGLNNFVGEFLILLGAFTAHRWWAVVATVGVILAALYMLWAYQRVFHGKAEGENAEMPDLRFREGLLLVPFLAGIVFLGVYPKPVIERMEPSVDALIAHVETNVDDFTEPVTQAGSSLGGAEADEHGDSHGDESHGEEG